MLEKGARTTQATLVRASARLFVLLAISLFSSFRSLDTTGSRVHHYSWWDSSKLATVDETSCLHVEFEYGHKFLVSCDDPLKPKTPPTCVAINTGFDEISQKAKAPFYVCYYLLLTNQTRAIFCTQLIMSSSPAPSALAAKAITIAIGLEYEKKVVSTATQYANREGAFYYLWKMQFRQLKFSVVQESSTAEGKAIVPKNAVNTCGDGFFSYYKNTYHGGPHVVFDDEQQYAQACTGFVAVIDSSDPKRAFVGQEVPNGWNPSNGWGNARSLVGGICYFDDDGKMDGTIGAFHKVVFDESDNEPFHWDNLFLCGNSLCYTWSYKDSKAFRLEGWLLREDVPLLKFSEEISGSWVYEERAILGGRWLCVPSYDGSWLPEQPKREQIHRGIDLWSIRQKGDEQKILYNSITFNDRLGREAGISVVLTSNYEPTEHDGFPVNCVKCHQPCVIGTVSYVPGDHQHHLGNSLCESCRIRYSKGKQSWLCWHVVGRPDVNRSGLFHCRCPVSPPTYECSTSQHHVDPIYVDCKVRRKKRPRWKIQAAIDIIVSRSDAPP